jgi:hypothetical protein
VVLLELLILEAVVVVVVMILQLEVLVDQVL